MLSYHNRKQCKAQLQRVLHKDNVSHQNWCTLHSEQELQYLSFIGLAEPNLSICSTSIFLNININIPKLKFHTKKLH